MTALHLARLGHRVLLAERATWPRHKVCGCCLNLRALGALDRAGLLPRIWSGGAQALRAVEVRAMGRAARIALPGGAALSRAVLDNILVEEAVAAGASFCAATAADLPPRRSRARLVSLEREGSARSVVARYVVCATGLGGGPLRSESWYAADASPSSRIGGGTLLDAAPEGYETGVIYMACGAGGYVGMEAVEQGRFDVAAAFDPAFVKTCGGLGPAAVRILGEAGQAPVEGLAAARWRGTPPLTRRAAVVACDGVFAAGDATGYVEPFTGEGMAWAMTSAEALAAIVDSALRGEIDAPERAWNAAYRGVVGRRQ